MHKFKLIAVLMAFCVCCTLLKAAAPAADDNDSASRQKLVQALLSTGDDQQKLLTELALNPSKIVHDTLLSWTHDEIYIYETPDAGPKIPILLEEQQNADGKVRAVRVDTGKILVDDKSKDMLFDPADLTSVDTDMRLRGTIQQALDMLALADPNIETRSDAVQKLGKSQKPQFIPILEARLDKEPSARIKKAIRIGIATLQIYDPSPQIKIQAINQLSSLSAIGDLDDLQKIADAKGTDPEVAKAAKAAVKSINGYISVVNFFGTIFRGMSSGSILLIVALGLAITFGLMGIINMAHGEMIAIGAYTVYVIENIFGSGFTFRVNLPISIAGHVLGFLGPGRHPGPGASSPPTRRSSSLGRGSPAPVRRRLSGNVVATGHHRGRPRHPARPAPAGRRGCPRADRSPRPDRRAPATGRARCAL